MTSMSQLSEEQLAAGPASESACDGWLEARIHLCKYMVCFSLWIGSLRTFALTMFDIDGMVPSCKIRNIRVVYLFYTYRIRENQDFQDRQTYWYSRPEVRTTSYRSSTVNHR